jgi:hypothetical protein
MPKMELVQLELLPPYAPIMPPIQFKIPPLKIEGGNFKLLNLILHTHSDLKDNI